MLKLVYNFIQSSLKSLSQIFNIKDFQETYYHSGIFNGKKALIIYKNFAFERVVRSTSLFEIRAIIEVLNSAGFDVTLVSVSDTGFDFNLEYDLVFGLGENFNKMCSTNNNNTRFVQYVTEGPQELASSLEKAEFDYLEARGVNTEKLIRRSHKIYSRASLDLDCEYIVLGDTHRWAGLINNPKSIRVTGFHPIVSEHTIGSFGGTRSVVWMGSGGIANKGLIRFIEICNTIRVDEAHIFGVDPRENDAAEWMLRTYGNFKWKNYGFVNYGTTELNKVIMSNSLVIFPSVSEALPTSCLTLMRNGMEIIVGPNCGFHGNEFGVHVCHTINEFEVKAAEILKLDLETRIARSMEIYRYANQEFCISAYKDQLYKLLQ